MVTPRSSRDPSHASIRLTKKNYHGKSLHSYLRKDSDNEDIQAQPASSPGTYSDDQENEAPPGFEDFDSEMGQRRRSHRGKKHKLDSESPPSSRKRTAEDAADKAKREAEKEEFLFSQSSQRSQKRSKHGYLSKQKRDSLSWKARSSNATSPRPKSSPSSSAPEPKAARSSQEVKDEAKNQAATEPQFIFPPTSSGVTSSAQIPTIFDSDDDSTDVPLSSASEAMLEEFDLMEDMFLSERNETEPAAPEPSLCPWCKKSVDPEALMKFKAQPKQRVREQQRFCESHQQTTAAKEWKERGLPFIDWDNFEGRIKGHFDDLDKILVPDSSSYYRNVLDTTLKAGKAKNFRLTLAGDALETICCGYYGTRGANKMYGGLSCLSVPQSLLN